LLAAGDASRPVPSSRTAGGDAKAEILRAGLGIVNFDRQGAVADANAFRRGAEDA
jgi:hypothetical protein